MKISTIILLILCTTCAKIPVQSLRLSSAMIEEGARMHQLNILLINAMFESKRDKIDHFIREEYTPVYIREFMSRVPEGTDLTKEMPEMMATMIPHINQQRDAMQAALEDQRIKVITKLNQDYAAYNEIALELYFLLESSTKVDEERKALLTQLNQRTGNQVDIDQLEKSLDNFILQSGAVGEKVTELNDRINSLLKN